MKGEHMKKEHQLATYLSKEEYKLFIECMYIETIDYIVDGGHKQSISTFLRTIVLKHLKQHKDKYNTQPLSTSPSPPAVAPITESSQRLSLSDLDW